jgi:hypothetical protein
MTKQQILDKHGKLPNWLVQLILLLGEKLLSFLIDRFKKKCDVCGLEEGHKLSCSKNY